MRLKNILLAPAIISTFTLPMLSLAAITGGPQTVGGIFDKIRTVINYLAVLFFLIATVFIIFAAYKYLTAAGDPDKVKSARDMFIYAIVAIVIGALAWAIPAIIQNFLGVNVEQTI